MRKYRCQEKTSGRHCPGKFTLGCCAEGLCAIRSGDNICARYVVSIREVRHGHAGHAELHAADDDGPDVLRAADADDLRGGPD